MENPLTAPTISIVSTEKGQYVSFYKDSKVTTILLDSGAEINCIERSECQRINAQILPTKQSAKQADGTATLKVTGETRFNISRGPINLEYEGIVCEKLPARFIGGIPFMKHNKITQHLNKGYITIMDKYIIYETSPLCPPLPEIPAVQSINLQHCQTLLPQEHVDLKSGGIPHTADYVLTPKDSCDRYHPQVSTRVGNSIRFTNTTDEPIILGKDIHAINVIKLTSPPETPFKTQTPSVKMSKQPAALNKIQIGEVSMRHRQELLNLHENFSEVFDDNLSAGYNGKSGNYDVDFHWIGEAPPYLEQGMVPSYTKKDQLQLLQYKIDELEAHNICAKAVDIGIIPKFSSPPMLVMKQSGKDIPKDQFNKMSVEEQSKYFRFVLGLDKLNSFILRQPSRHTSIPDTIHAVAQYQYVITTDLTSSFFQRHVKEDKLPFFTFESPFKGTYVMLRSPQGLINQSEGLTQLMSGVLGNYIQDGWCVVHHDNLYILANSQDTAIHRWSLVLKTLAENNLKCSPKKTFVLTERMELLGWIKEGRKLIPDPHRQQAILHVPLPRTVKQLRSYIGAYRTFYEAKPKLAHLMDPLEQMTAGKPSSEKLAWTDQQEMHFKASKEEMKKLDNLYIPSPADQLVVTCDWSKEGMSATLYAMKDGQHFRVSNFSSKTPENMKSWPPCDAETATAVIALKSSHFSSFIRESKNPTICLVDSKTMVQASKLLKKGRFSSSHKINKLLRLITDLPIVFQHISGKLGFNFRDDFNSRNPFPCPTTDCHTCQYVDETTKAAEVGIICESFLLPDSFTVGNVSSLPFQSRSGILKLQEQDPELQVVRDYIQTGSRPNKKNTKCNLIKHILNLNVEIASDGALVVKNFNKMTKSTEELLLLPSSVAQGILTAWHIKMNHPSAYQMKKQVARKFVVPFANRLIDEITNNCYLCASTARLPEDQVCKPNLVPEHPGQGFTADVLKMDKQKIMVVVDNFSGHVMSAFIESEKKEDLVNGIITCVTPFKSAGKCVVRVDNASGFKTASDHPSLQSVDICLELGNAKNKNALAIVDKVIQELNSELRKLIPTHSLNNLTLVKATKVLNEKVRSQNLTAKEITFMRNQDTGKHIKISDKAFGNHKQVKRPIVSTPSVKIPVGSLVFVNSDGNKHQARDIYLVTGHSWDGQLAIIQKLIHGMTEGRMQIKNTQYKVKFSNLTKAPGQGRTDWRPEEKITANCRELPKPADHRRLPKPADHRMSPKAKKYPIDQNLIEFGYVMRVPNNQTNLEPCQGIQVQEFLHQERIPSQASYEQPYLLQRQIWERQLQLSRIREHSNNYADLKALEEESRELVQNSRSQNDTISSPEPTEEDDAAEFKTPENARPKRACVQQTLSNIYQSITGNIPQVDGGITDSDRSNEPTPNQSPEGQPLHTVDTLPEETSLDDCFSEYGCFMCHRSCPTLLDPHIFGSDEPPVMLFENVRKRSSSLSDMELYTFNRDPTKPHM